MKKFFLSLLFSLLFFPTILSQNSQLQNFNTKEGLPQSQVYDLVQDSIGYLWVATQGGGLARFDGHEFTVFNEKKGLQSNFVNSLLVSNDSLFVGTFSGLSIYSKGKFTNFESPKIHKIVMIDQQVYLATERGIYSYHNASLMPLQTVAKIDTNAVTDIAKSNDSYLIATKKGLWILNQLEQPRTADQLDSADYTSLLKVDDRIYATTYDRGFKSFYKGTLSDILPQLKGINAIFCINRDYWVATDRQGIIILDAFFKEKQQINQNNGLAINQIKSILKDTQDNIWIATSGGGLYKLTQNNFQHFDRNSGLKGNRIYAVHSVEDDIWISHSERGVTRMDRMGIHPIFEDRGFLNVKAKTIASDGFDNIWVGTEGKGILIFKRKYMELDSLQEVSKFDMLDEDIFPDYILETDTLAVGDGLNSNYIKKILIQGTSVWVATNASGIQTLSYDKLGISVKVRNSYGTNEGINDLLINDLKLDDGKLWYATRKGNLGFLDRGKVRDFYQILGKEIAISTMVFQGNNLFLGTLGDGVWIVNKDNPREIKRLSGIKDLNSNNVYQLIFDNENHLWVGTEKGVNKVVLDANNSIEDVFYFDRSDGFLGIETCQNAVAKDVKGNIWFGTMNGLTKYIPSQSKTRKIQPTIYFEKIEVAYQALDSINIRPFRETLTLKPTENHLSFQFKSVDINHPKGIEYRWKLNENVSPWSAKDFIDFANLNTGEYTFTVWARNIDWMESDPAVFHFFIDQPVYQKSWFLWTAYASLAFIILLMVFIISRRMRLKNKQKVEQLELENHLLSLEQKALQLQMNPHFIFNVLNGIKAMGHEGDTNRMSTTINTFATLLRSILNSSRLEEISLLEEINTLSNYLTLEQQMVSKPFVFEIQHDTHDIDPEEILIPPMLIQPFVENSVKHGFQQHHNGGKIDISFKVDGEFLECQVRDNGVGITHSKSSKKSHHPSTALKVTKERIESLTMDHQFEIREENGTIVSFRLPLKTDF